MSHHLKRKRKKICPTSPKHICKQLRYDMISHSQLRPRTFRCILKSLFSRPGSPAMKHSESETSPDENETSKQHPALRNGRNDVYWSCSFEKFAQVCSHYHFLGSHGPAWHVLPHNTTLYCHLPVASIVLASFHCKFYATCNYTVYQQESSKSMDARTFEFYMHYIDVCQGNIRYCSVCWEPVGGWLAAEVPFSSQYRHCGRANHACKVQYEDIKWKLCTSAKLQNCCFKCIHLPFSPIVSRCLYVYLFESLRKSNFSSGPGRLKYSWGTSGTHFFTSKTLWKRRCIESENCAESWTFPSSVSCAESNR